MTNESPNQFFKTLNILFVALLMGQILFAGVSIIILNIVSTNGLADSNFEYGNYLIPIVTISCLGMGMFLLRKKVQSINKNAPLEEKLNEYRAAKLIQWAITEVATLLSIIFYLLSGYINFIIIAAVIILYFLTLRPQKGRIINELQLNNEEQNQLM